MKYCYTLIFLSIGTSFSMEKPPKKDTSEISHSKSDKHVHGSKVKYKSGSKIITHPSKPASSKGALVRSATQRLGLDLIDAVKQGEYSRVKSLLAAGSNLVNPEITDDTKETPLFAAIEAQPYNDKILAKLLEHHANPDQKVRGIAPLTQALTLKREKAALRLMYSEAKTNEDVVLTPEFMGRELFYEIEKKRIARVKLLVKLGAPVNIRHDSDEGEKDTPLLAAIDVPEKFNKDIFEEVAAIADVNLCAQNGLSPLYKAVLWNNEEAARFLVLRDANVEYRMPFYQKTSFSVLQLAQQMNMNELITTIKSLELSKSSSTEKLKERIDKDKLVAELTRQSTPRRTTSPRAAVPKP